ncbi:hypothetical protein D3C80_1581650 [compost metagenome]
MGIQALAYMLTQRFFKLGTPVDALGQHHERLDQFGTFRVRLADDCGLDHRGVLDQRALDVERPHAIPGRGNHVIAAANETDAAISVKLDGVATEVVLADERLGRQAVVAAEPAKGRLLAVDGQGARLARRQFVTLLVQHHDAMAGDGETSRPQVYGV